MPADSSRVSKIQLIDEHYERILTEWADIMSSALLLRYLLERGNDNSVLILALYHAAPLRICKLWGLQGDKHITCLKNMHVLVKRRSLYEFLRDEFKDRWGQIRNRQIAHYDPGFDIPKATIRDLMVLCILVGFYIEDIGTNIQSELTNSKTLIYPFMSSPQGQLSDFSCVLDVEDHLLVLIEKLLSRPYCVVHEENYNMVLDSTGIFLDSAFVRESHRREVWGVYTRYKKEALEIQLHQLLKTHLTLRERKERKLR